MFLRIPLRAAALATLLSISLGAWAQTNEAGLSDQDRAKRDASKVFNFIKFHAVRPAKAADKTGDRVADKAPEKPADKSVESRVALAPARPSSDVQMAGLEPARTAPMPGSSTQPMPAAVLNAKGASALPSEPPAAAISEPQPASPGLNQAAATNSGATSSVATPAVAALVASPQPAPAVTPEPEPEEEASLQLVEYVEPELPRANNVTTLKGGTVTVRFEVGTDGKVVSAVAREGAPRRLALAASRAVQQWRFAPLSAAREAEVDIVFNLD